LLDSDSFFENEMLSKLEQIRSAGRQNLLVTVSTFSMPGAIVGTDGGGS
jgi:hypothetical protein